MGKYDPKPPATWPLTVYVKDETSQPLKNALVQFTSHVDGNTYHGYTDDTGHVLFNLNKATRETLVNVSLDGYQTYVGTYALVYGTDFMPIQLSKVVIPPSQPWNDLTEAQLKNFKGNY